jgi:soluble cytochrome b562
MSPPSRPASADADDIAKWEAEVRAEELRLQDERDFREEMRQFVGRVDATLTNIKEGQHKHAADDVRQFRRIRKSQAKLALKVGTLDGQVTQTVQTNRYNWGVVAAWVSAFVALAGVGWALIEKFGGALQP